FLLTGAHSDAWPRSVTATTFAANWLWTVMPVGLGPETPERSWHRKWRMLVGVCPAGGGGATRLLAVGPRGRVGVRTSAVEVPNWFATWTPFGSRILGVTFTKS